MKANMNRLLSLSVTDSEYFSDSQNKIEFVSCPLKEIMCKGHLIEVNKSFIESENYRRKKDFQLTIETLKNAFYRTFELNESPCSNCTKLFRSTITESLENIHYELDMMTKGIFGNKRYRSSYQQADIVLKEFENLGLRETLQLNVSKNQFSDNYLNRSASF